VDSLGISEFHALFMELVFSTSYSLAHWQLEHHCQVALFAFSLVANSKSEKTLMVASNRLVGHKSVITNNIE